MRVHNTIRMCIVALIAVTSCSSPSDESPSTSAAGQENAAHRDDQDPTRLGETEYQWTGDGPKVVILGDSLTVSSRDELRERLDDVSLKIGAHFGEGLAGGALSAATGSPLMESIATTYSADPPEVAVIALGTNDAWLAELDLEGATTG